jgi:hypothetical protein
MWSTPLGERVLGGAEWELFRGGLSMVRDLVEEAKSSDDPEIGSVGVEAFDLLQPNQKLALLTLVGKALKDEGEPMPELTAHTEATVAAVSSEDVDEWEFLVGECLANRILGADGDHEGGPGFMDADPAVSRYCRDELGIAEDYYTAISPDPTDEQLDSVRRTLREVCGG